jgi:hypothetical protein
MKKRLLYIGVVAAGAVLASGCETVSEDLSDFANSFSSVSPGEAARMAADLNDADRRRQGVLLLSNAPWGGADAYLKLYRDYAVSDGDPIVRAVSVRALARHGQPSDAPAVASNLTHESGQVRWEAAKGLQRLHATEVVGDMLRVLRNEQEEARIRAAIACGLAQYPEDRVFHALIGALDAEELSVNVASQRALVTLTGGDLGLDARVWLEWYNRTLANGDPFAGRQEYLYPTYQRDNTFLETMIFWSSNTYEEPAPPAGLHPADRRTTYQDDAEADGDDEDQGSGEADQGE